MNLTRNVFLNSPFPVFLIEPIIKNNECVDFKYVEVNEAFSKLLNLNIDKINGHRFLELFEDGEKTWFRLFYDVLIKKDTIYQSGDSPLISKKLHVVAYPILDKYVACVIFESSDMTIENIEKLEEKANIDLLTGLFNRNYLSGILDFDDKCENFGVSFFDLNNLKFINDTYGHFEGDLYIKKFVNLLKDNLKTSLIFRFGGDEFLAIEKNISEADFLNVQNNLKKILDETKISAIGFKYYYTGKISKAIVECDKLMYLHKKALKGKERD